MRDIKMKLMVVVMLTTLASTSVLAESYRCIGMDPTGKVMHVLFDDETDTLNVNGTILKVEAPTKAKNGFATEDYELENGKKAYVSLVVEDKDKIVMRQMDAKTDDELSKVDLACK